MKNIVFKNLMEMGFKDEEFEKAAVIRDLINELKSSN